MEDHPIAERIPWYVTGKLPAEEAVELESHLRDCDGCRGLLEQARAQLDFASDGLPDELLEHVEPGLLTIYAERPEQLEPEVRRWVERTVERCVDCREALERLGEIDAPVALDRSSETGLARLWQSLTATILQPAPALAYLVLLAMLVPAALWMRDRQGSPALLPVPERLTTGSEAQVRDSGQAPERPPLGIPPDPVVWMDLETGLDAGDVEARRFTAELWRGDRRLHARPVGKGEFDMREGRAVLSLVLDAVGMKPGVSYEIRLRVDEPGDPLDEQILFRRRVRVARNEGDGR